jgi:hypothetical protein
MGKAQTGSMRMFPGLWDRITTRSLCVNSLERQPQKVTALYCRDSRSGGIPSSTGHGKSGVNPGGPPSKAKYYSATDNEPVARAKDEKNRKDRS